MVKTPAKRLLRSAFGLKIELNLFFNERFWDVFTSTGTQIESKDFFLLKGIQV